ncbi:MAG: HlyD family efflux transporter periplasmic adaptor subunit [Myxococcales bacterium]|nr:MAG: HlyD family efflux transporter periplasmic adaptor subunit [Myxococcales bacterium]
MGNERTAVELRYAAQIARVENLESRIASLRASQRAQIDSARAKVQITTEELASKEQDLQAAKAEFETNQINFTRQQKLKEEGLASVRDLELAELAFRQSQAKVQSSEAEVRAAKQKLEQERANLNQAQASSQASISDAEASLQSAQTDIASTNATLARLDVDIARQKQQTVVAPADGTILRVLVRQGGEQVKQGAVLAVMVPDVDDRAVALFVDGNDAALIRRNYKVRLQFEGWPAIQFSGWPSVAAGTFGGRVAFVDAADDGQGNFRILVVPDPKDEPWPNPNYLRQGVRAKGWFLLRQVPLGFEIWRQFNGFPPATSPPPPDKTKGSS